MPLHSMTAFARETETESDTGHNALVVELRSVNHRYLDCHFKTPDSLRALEPKLREALAKTLGRGKVDCFIRASEGSSDRSLSLDEVRLKEVLSSLARIRETSPEVTAPSSLEVLQFPGVCKSGDGNDDAMLQKQAFNVFSRALAKLNESREREGAQLATFLEQRLAAIKAEVTSLRKETPALRGRQEARLRKRLADLDEPTDPGRIEQELVLLLQKSDVDEELDRLAAHIEEVERILAKGGPCGRRLDFLMQELNREANTLSSKATATTTTQSAVELKVLIEQMREQVQNIE